MKKSPTGALDSKNGNEVITLLQDSVKKLDQTLVLITHNIDLAREADRIVRMMSGMQRAAIHLMCFMMVWVIMNVHSKPCHCRSM